MKFIRGVGTLLLVAALGMAIAPNDSTAADSTLWLLGGFLFAASLIRFGSNHRP
jgi:hypothetical protein